MINLHSGIRPKQVMLEESNGKEEELTAKIKW